MSVNDTTREHADRYARIGLSLQWLCGPTCPGNSHGRGHDPEMAGKVPIRAGWSQIGYRPSDALLASYPGGANLSILTGHQPTARLSVAVVDLDSPEALTWAVAHLPVTPWRVRTRRGEHWYYRCAGPVSPRNFRHCAGPNGGDGLAMEVLGDGRQVVAPPSVHRSGHVYAEIGEPWGEESAATLPLYDPAWFAELAPRRAPPGAGWGDAAGTVWPGEREFTVEEFGEAWERCAAYLDAPKTPVSVSGKGGDETLYSICLAALRGFPIASRTRLEALRAERVAGARVDASDALSETLRLIQAYWNPRCLDSDGETRYPWDEERLTYKLGQAAQADRMGGPDFWLYDDAEHQAKWRALRGGPPRQVVRVAEEPAPVVDAAPERWRRWAESWEGDGPRFAGLLGGDEPIAPDAPAQEPDRGRCAVTISTDIVEMAQAAQAALGRVPEVFVYNRRICDLIQEPGVDREGKPHRPVLRETPLAHLTAVLSRCARWEGRRGRGEEDGDEDAEPVAKRPDRQAVAALAAAGAWPELRQVRAIVHTPVIRPNGSILQTPGWDPPTGILYVPEEPDFVSHRVLTSPSRSNCARALAFLLDVIGDFPFPAPEHARAVWLSAVLTRFARPAFTGNVPMFVVSANTRGAGKGLLVDAACLITDGRPAAKVPYVGDGAEDQRQIVAYLRDGTANVCLDNIERGKPLASVSFEAMLTASDGFGGRIVGTSQSFRAKNADCTWWATGHGLRTGGDMSRRILRIDIEDRNADPAGRRREHADLEGWVRANRARYARAALTLLSGWCAAGRPAARLPPLESFVGWSDVVRQCVVWCGLPDPAESRGKAGDDDDDQVRAAALVHLEPLGVFKPSELVREFAAGRLADLMELLDDARVTTAGRGARESIGRFLAKHAGHPTPHEGRTLRLERLKHNAGGARWQVHAT